MTKPLPRASVPFSEPADQLGCVVPDLGAAISEWVAKGVGPFLTLPGVTLDCSYRGRKSKPKIGVAFSQQGDLQIELIQPLNDEPSTYHDFLAAGGNGPHHHGWFCQDYAAATADAARAGRVELQRSGKGASHFVYYEPRNSSEMIGELVKLGEVNRLINAVVRREADQWDGISPSRSLLRVTDWGTRWSAAKLLVGTLLGRS
jgi:hypothetical protein